MGASLLLFVGGYLSNSETGGGGVEFLFGYHLAEFDVKTIGPILNPGSEFCYCGVMLSGVCAGSFCSRDGRKKRQISDGLS